MILFFVNLIILAVKVLQNQNYMKKYCVDAPDASKPSSPLVSSDIFKIIGLVVFLLVILGITFVLIQKMYKPNILPPPPETAGENYTLPPSPPPKSPVEIYTLPPSPPPKSPVEIYNLPPSPPPKSPVEIYNLPPSTLTTTSYNLPPSTLTTTSYNLPSVETPLETYNLPPIPAY
jgi:hypothetical protein